MKILITATTFPRWIDDSEPPFIFLLAKSLIELNHEIIVLVPHDNKAKFMEIMEGVKIYRFPYFFPFKLQKLCYKGGMLPNMKKSILAKFQVPFFLISEMVFLSYLIFKEKPQLIHAHWIIPQGLIASLITKFKNIPLVISIHGSDVFAFQKGIMKKLITRLVSSGILVTVNSSATKAILKNTFQAEKVSKIPMGIDPLVFNPSKKDQNLKKQLSPNGPLLLYVGRLVEQKGVHFLIDAMADLKNIFPSIKLVIIGDGPYRNYLENRVKTSNLDKNVLFLGKITNSKLPAYYASADIFIGPSITLSNGTSEALGVVFLESLASGTPVVSTNIGGISDIIKHQITGIVVKEKSADEIVSAVSDLIQKKELTRTIRQNGLELVDKEFSWNQIAKKFSYHFQQISYER